MSALAARCGEILREAHRITRGVLGADAYDQYLRHHRVTGCTSPPLGEKEFWRERHAQQDRNPEGRCC